VQFPRAKSLRWNIPITLADTAHPGTTTNLLLQGKSTRISLADCSAVIKANAGDNGYYRVKYSSALFGTLKKNINQLPAADRLNLLNDTWAFVEADQASAVEYFELVGSLKDEPSTVIWDQVLAKLYLVDLLQKNQPGRTAFRDYARAILRPPFMKLGWEPKSGEPVNAALLRPNLIAGLAYFGDQEIISGARTRFAAFLQHPESLAPDLRPPVVRIAGRYGDKTIHDQIHELARNATNVEERQLYYNALSLAQDPALLRDTFAISLTDETVPQEAIYLVSDAANVGHQPELAWEFARQNLKSLFAKLSNFERDNYIPSIFTSFSDNARADELLAFVKKNVSSDSLMRAREVAEEIRFKAGLKRRELPRIDAWIKKQTTKQ
jgi:aminopeptidase N